RLRPSSPPPPPPRRAYAATQIPHTEATAAMRHARRPAMGGRSAQDPATAGLGPAAMDPDPANEDRDPLLENLAGDGEKAATAVGGLARCQADASSWRRVLRSWPDLRRRRHQAAG
ncbi:unnamed protein product, partial [Urochloa humidicola]